MKCSLEQYLPQVIPGTSLYVVAVEGLTFIDADNTQACDLCLGLQGNCPQLKLLFSPPELFSRSWNRLHCENWRGGGLCG